MKLPFVKYHGAGNDFVLMDFLQGDPCDDLPALARSVCDRRHGIGADGLLVLKSSNVADFQMQIFNADGSEPAMCGNGIRCLADYIFKKTALTDVRIETMAGVLQCRKCDGQIAVNMGKPTKLHWPIDVEGESVYIVDTGVPHAVVFREELDHIDVEAAGRRLRSHPSFAPHGVNVNFVSVNQGQVALRTYERGVEGETLACGTGSAAAALAAMEVMQVASPVAVLTRGCEQLWFSASPQGEIEMLGPVVEVFDGMYTENG